jgi:hypothetical protein
MGEVGRNAALAKHRTGVDPALWFDNMLIFSALADVVR